MKSPAERLIDTIASYGSAAVAFSGGIDSTVVARAARSALGDRAVAVTGTSASLAEGELEEARALARHIGIRHVVLETNEFANPDYVRNDGSRCFHCKSELYDRVLAMRQELSVDVVCSGANLDDQGDYRPGLLAAELRHVRHPLQEAGFTKSMVRTLAQEWGLPNWDKPATPCLSSRIAVGVEATPERARRVDQAERFLVRLGLSTVRVRYHPGDLARIEVEPDQIARLADREVRQAIVEAFTSLGFQFVTIDLAGFRTGSLNALIDPSVLQLYTPTKPLTDAT